MAIDKIKKGAIVEYWFDNSNIHFLGWYLGRCKDLDGIWLYEVCEDSRDFEIGHHQLADHIKLIAQPKPKN